MLLVEVSDMVEGKGRVIGPITVRDRSKRLRSPLLALNASQQ
jgi:hypothetical protein